MVTHTDIPGSYRTAQRTGQPGAEEERRPGPNPRSAHQTGPHAPYDPAEPDGLAAEKHRPNAAAAARDSLGLAEARPSSGGAPAVQAERESPERAGEARSEDTSQDLSTAEAAMVPRRPHDEGSDANDTADGLTPSEEAVRQAAEDIPSGSSPAGPIETVPVFDRAKLPPKV